MKSVFLERNHLFLRDPRGGNEDVAAMLAAGFGAIFCNVGDFTVGEWDTHRKRAKDLGVVCGPWLRTHNSSGGFSETAVDELVEIADDWGQPFIVNSESELKGTGGEATGYIAEAVGDRDAAISMEAWPFDKVEWFRLAAYPMMPQQSSDYTWYEPDSLREIWRAYGCPCVVITHGSFGGSTPDQYERKTPYGAYTADDMGGNYAAWGPLGTIEPCAGSTPTPPPNGGGDVPDDTIPTPQPGEVIGSNHGITALVDWLQKQPSMPTRGADYDPAKPKTWPWPERVERTLRILAADHDAALPRSAPNPDEED